MNGIPTTAVPAGRRALIQKGLFYYVMCGVFGIMGDRSDKVPDMKRLQETSRLLHHRGPDSNGIYRDAGVGLVHTRLALLDPVHRSDQPFWDEKKRYCIVYNGEIYNFRELRSELEKLGRSLRTNSDTEVLLECILHYGPESILPRLEGMFAFAVYDKVNHTLLLARDRFGIKPLYVYEHGGLFAFASEVGALRPWIKLEPDLLTISAYLQRYEEPTYQGSTYYKYVKFFPPGSFFNVQNGNSAQICTFFSLCDYWDPDRNEHLKGCNENEVIDRVEEALFESVRMQLVADVPVGALCSGGVDSALVTAIAAKVHDNLGIFHANVAGKLSEYDAAYSVAKVLKLDLKSVEVNDEDFLNRFIEVIRHYDHPFLANPHSIPFYMVARLVQENTFKAILTGEGADECFLGYEWLAPDIRNWRRIIKKKLAKGIQTLSRFFPERRMETDSGAGVGRDVLVAQLHDRFEHTQRYQQLTRFRGANGETIPRRLLKSLIELGCTLPSLLHRNDSLGMAASIESRFPFLDHQLVELAVNLPYEFKIRPSTSTVDPTHYFFENKWVLRKVAERHLPRSLSHRKKMAFPTDTFSRIVISPTFFPKSLVADLFGLSTRETLYLAEQADPYFRLQLFHLEVWLHVCLHQFPEQSALDKLKDYIRIKAE